MKTCRPCSFVDLRAERALAGAAMGAVAVVTDITTTKKPK